MDKDAESISNFLLKSIEQRKRGANNVIPINNAKKLADNVTSQIIVGNNNRQTRSDNAVSQSIVGDGNVQISGK